MRFLRLFYRHFDAKNILNDGYFLGITSRWPLFMCKQSEYSLNSLQYYVRISFANDVLVFNFYVTSSSSQFYTSDFVLSYLSVLFSRGSSFCFFCCRLANYGHPFASGMDWHHIASLRGRRKRGGGGGREKGKREGSACSKSLCFCITPTNFLVIRLRLLSIKCRYTRHCRKHYTHGLKKFA